LARGRRCPCAIAPPTPDHRRDRDSRYRHKKPEQYPWRKPQSAERQRNQLHHTQTERQQQQDQSDDQQNAAQTGEYPRAGWRDQQAHRTQRQHLTPARGRLTKSLDSLLQIACAPFGKRQRRVGHAPELHAFLGPRGGYRTLEVSARLLGVKALGGTGAQYRQRGRLVLRLRLELLVRALLQRLDRLLGAALLDPNLSLLGGHSPSFYVGRVQRARAAGLRRYSRFSPLTDPSETMRQISWHIQLLAILTVLCFAGQSSLLTTTVWAASGSVSLSSSQKAELDKQVQEQLAKVKAGQSGSSSPGAPAAGSSGEGLGGSAEGSSNLIQKAEAEAKTGEEPATKTTATSSTESSSGISMGVLVPIFIAGALLLGGIAFLIVRDARNVAPVGDGLVGGSVQDKAARQRKRRAKAKAARQQRKRNR
jgi:hypothetical protein